MPLARIMSRPTVNLGPAALPALSQLALRPSPLGRWAIMGLR